MQDHYEEHAEWAGQLIEELKALMDVLGLVYVAGQDLSSFFKTGGVFLFGGRTTRTHHLPTPPGASGRLRIQPDTGHAALRAAALARGISSAPMGQARGPGRGPKGVLLIRITHLLVGFVFCFAPCAV